MSYKSPSEQRNVTPATVLVLVAAAVIILIAGILIGAFLRGDSGDGSPAIASDSISNRAESSTDRDQVGVADPAVTAWHDKLWGPIASAVSILTNNMPETEQEVIRACETLTLAVGDLEQAPTAPKEDLEESFRAWVTALSAAVATCDERVEGQDPTGWIATVNASLSATSGQFDAFGQTLDLYYDFDAPPPVQ